MEKVITMMKKYRYDSKKINVAFTGDITMTVIQKEEELMELMEKYQLTDVVEKKDFDIIVWHFEKKEVK